MHAYKTISKSSEQDNLAGVSNAGLLTYTGTEGSFLAVLSLTLCLRESRGVYILKVEFPLWYLPSFIHVSRKVGADSLSQPACGKDNRNDEPRHMISLLRASFYFINAYLQIILSKPQELVDMTIPI